MNSKEVRVALSTDFNDPDLHLVILLFRLVQMHLQTL